MFTCAAQCRSNNFYFGCFIISFVLGENDLNEQSENVIGLNLFHFVFIVKLVLRVVRLR